MKKNHNKKCQIFVIQLFNQNQMQGTILFISWVNKIQNSSHDIWVFLDAQKWEQKVKDEPSEWCLHQNKKRTKHGKSNP